jgi:hypothetical protein
MGVWRAWWRTCVLSLRRPAELGRRLVRFTATDAVTYAVFTHLLFFIGGVALLATGTAIDTALHGRDFWLGLGPFICGFGTAVFAAFAWPVCTTFIFGSITHALMLALGSRGKTIDVTVTCIFYAQGPLALGGVAAVPLIGPVLLAGLYAGVLVLIVIILARAHGVGAWMPAAAVIGTPLVLLLVFEMIRLAHMINMAA